MSVIEHIQDAETTEGEDVAERKLMVWLGKITGSLEQESELELAVFEVSKRDGEQKLQDFTFDPAEDDLANLVRQILDAAVDDVEVQKKTVQYAVRIEGRDGCKKFTLKATRPRDNDEDPDDYEDFDEPPTAKGQVALALDQSFRFAKLSLKESRENRKMDRETIREKNAEIARLQRQIADNMRVIERAHSQQFMRDLELKKFEKSEQRKEQIVGGVMQVGLPALAAHLSGGKMPAGAFMRPPPAPTPPSPGPAPAPSAGSSAAASGAAAAAAPSGPAPVEAARLAYDKRTGEEIDELIGMISQEQLPAIQATDAFTIEQKQQLMTIINTRIDCQKACRGG